MNNKLSAVGKSLATIASLPNPIAGAVGSILLEAASLHYAKKNETLFDEILFRLRALESSGILAVNELLVKEDFLTLLLTAATVAQRTHRKEKILRIRNAVVSFAVRPPQSAESDRFFHLVDQLTEEHFLILQILSDHLAEFAGVDNFPGLYEVFSRYYSHLSLDAFGHYLFDLKSRRLIRISATIEDDEGLTVSTLLSTGGGEKGELIILSEIAKELLDFTSEQ